MERRHFFRGISVLTASTLAAAMTSPVWANSTRSNGDTGKLPQLAVEDWKSIREAAVAAGDADAAEAAEYGASVAESRARTDAGELVIAPMVVPTLIKKAVKAALKYGGHKVPAPIRPYTNKMLNVLENAEAWEEAALTTGFMAVGIPPDVSQQAAYWIVTFVG